MSDTPSNCPENVRDGRETDEVQRLIRARRLLVGTLDAHRAIVGRVSPAWILSEVERRVPWDRVSEPLQRRLRPVSGPPPKEINTNWLPKLEPELNAHVLAGVMLFGARLYGHGTPDQEAGVGFQEKIGRAHV